MSECGETARSDGATQPKMPPCALIIAIPAAWNSGKYEPMQSSSTRQSKPRSLASRTVVLTQTSVVTPQTSKLGDAAAAQHGFEVGGVERALAGLVDDRLAVDGGEFGDDVVAGLAAHQDAAHRAGIADAGGELAARPLGRRRGRRGRDDGLRGCG